ncbi:MAG: hypothetical protein IKC17_02685 [Bacteroidales bacterium]|nr:hypothetical protein [Bacteroidales bacterium]
MTEQENNGKDGREWLILLLSIISALIIWLMHNLSMTYSVFLEYEVEMSTSLQGRVNHSTSEEVLIIRGKANGYYILAQRFGKRSKIVLDVLPEDIRQNDQVSDLFYVNTADITGNIVGALDEDVELEFVVTERLDFLISRMEYKRVPIVPRMFIEYSGQYMPVGDISLKPDSIDIYGEAHYISVIDSVWTEAFYETDVKTSLNGILDIVPQRHIQYSTNSVYYTIDVARYVEETVTVKVETVDLPQEKDMIILPSTVDVTYRRFFSRVRFDDDDVRFIVKYSDYLQSINSRVVPVWDNMPQGIITYEINPRVVDCIVIDK